MTALICRHCLAEFIQPVGIAPVRYERRLYCSTACLMRDIYPDRQLGSTT